MYIYYVAIVSQGISKAHSVFSDSSCNTGRLTAGRFTAGRFTAGRFTAWRFTGGKFMAASAYSCFHVWRRFTAAAAEFLAHCL